MTTLVCFILSAFMHVLFPMMGQTQVGIHDDDMDRNVTLKAVILDKETHEPIPYATFYLIPQGDTIISNCSFSDKDGIVIMSKILPRPYMVHAEMLGYESVSFLKALESDCDMGTILMKMDPAAIDPSKIEAYVRPMTVRKDTIQYNADAFPVMENSVLEDLLKRFPGLTIKDDGSVYVNDKPINRITVEGKTFFLNDPVLVLQTLPAKVVDKILVINQVKKNVEYSGIVSSDDKENVMDIRLKEEYLTGAFGRFSFDGGTQLEERVHEETDGTEGMLFNANSMASYSDNKGQLTLLAIGNNVKPDNTNYIIDKDDLFSLKDGFSSTLKAGLNYNTGRIAGMESSASVSWHHSKKTVMENTASDLISDQKFETLSSNEFLGQGTDDEIISNIYLTNVNTSHYFIEVCPTLSLSWKGRETFSNSGSTSKVISESTGSTNTLSHARGFGAGISWSSGLKSIGGKEGRTLTFSGDLSAGMITGDKLMLESSCGEWGRQDLSLHYDSDTDNTSANGMLSYSEPLSQRWILQAVTAFLWDSSRDIDDVVNVSDGTRNDYHSSELASDGIQLNERILLQYRKDAFSFSFGPLLENNRARYHSLNLGKKCMQDGWISSYTPHAMLGWHKERFDLSIDYDGQNPNTVKTLIQPVLNVSDPLRLIAGNIYLKPFHLNSFFGNIRATSKDCYRYVYMNPGMIVTHRPFVMATWFDSEGIQYMIPVNSRKAQKSVSLSGGYNASFGDKKNWNVNLNGRISSSSSMSYQAKSVMDGIDTDNFDYSGMMSIIWGRDEKGDLFYSGKSGFRESLLSERYRSVSGSVTYRKNHISFQVGGTMIMVDSDYSLNPEADINWNQYVANAELTWNNRKGFQAEISSHYVNYSGFTNGYDKPEYILNAKLSKDIRKITFTVTANDILDQHNSFRRTSNNMGVVEQQSLILGRYVLVGVSFHFGNPSPKAKSLADDAIRDI